MILFERERVLGCFRPGEILRSAYIAKKIGVTTQRASSLLKRLEKDGKVKRSDRYSSEKNIAWERA